MDVGHPGDGRRCYGDAYAIDLHQTLTVDIVGSDVFEISVNLFESMLETLDVVD